MTESLFSASDFLDLLGDESPTETYDLGLETMVKPVCEDPKARKKAKHREAMVEFRLNKKQKQNNLLLEHRRLEDRMKALVAAAKAAAARTGGTTDTLQELVVEREILRSQNIALREEIQRHEKFKKIVLEARDDPMEKEESTLLSGDGESGWRVRFEDAAEPSFHFHPFTRDEFDTKIKQFESELKTGKASLVKVGSFFGWDVLRAPLVSASDGKSLLARSKVSKRLRCSLDVHQKMSYTKQKDLSPLVVTPMGWGLHKRTNVSTQVLQEFDQDSIVFVHSIPGPEKALRYFFQVRRAQWTLRDGRRKLMASLVITDSEANRRSREAEDSHDKVEWATEGAINVSVTEVDDNSIDVVCDHWAACESELHAEYLMIQWTQFAVWWEQLIVPTNLLLQKT